MTTVQCSFGLSQLVASGRINNEVNPENRVDNKEGKWKQNSAAAVDPLYIDILVGEHLDLFSQRRHLPLQVFCFHIIAFSFTSVPSIALRR